MGMKREELHEPIKTWQILFVAFITIPWWALMVVWDKIRGR